MLHNTKNFVDYLNNKDIIFIHSQGQNALCFFPSREKFYTLHLRVQVKFYNFATLF